MSAPLMLFVNPYGLRVVRYYRTLLIELPVERYVSEWRPPRVGSILSAGFFAVAVLVAGIVVYALARQRPPALVPAVATLVPLAVTVMSARNQSWFLMSAAVLGSVTLARLHRPPPAMSRGFLSVGAAAVGVVAVASVASAVVRPPGSYHLAAPRKALEAVAAYAEADPAARVLADDDSAAGLLWLHPQLVGRVAFDIRYEVYNAGRLVQYFELVNGRETAAPLLAGYDVVVASVTGSPTLIDLVTRLPGWRTVHADGEGVVLVRG
jgi:hypothetical protein